jgi:L,D-transpeptidase YcbB
LASRKNLAAIGAFCLASCGGAGGDPSLPEWSSDQIDSLKRAIAAAPQDALPLLGTGPLERAEAKWFNHAETRRAATELAEKLAVAHLRGCAAPAERVEWYVDDVADSKGLRARLQQALATDDSIEAFFQTLRPASPDYASLREAYRKEANPVRRLSIGRNMERWRWMPQNLGDDHVLANIPSFEVGLWRGGALVSSWPTVVGKIATQTPSLTAQITGVTFNPWWDLPRSIIEEGERFSARRGYVVLGPKRVRQKPGPGNALGEMKIEMLNPHAIYLHDTPSKGLFSRTYRAYSHGCVRVKDALDFAEAVLGGSKTRDEIDALRGFVKVVEPPDEGLMSRPGAIPAMPVEKKVRIGEIRSQTAKLPTPMPVYIGYFTVSARPDGSLRFDKDIYQRDAAIADPSNPKRACADPPARPPLPKPSKPRDTAPEAGNLSP